MKVIIKGFLLGSLMYIWYESIIQIGQEFL